MANDFNELSGSPDAPASVRQTAPDGVAGEKWTRLEAFLETLPPGAAARLFAAIETARARGDEGLPTTAIINTLRTRLFGEGARFPARALTAQRLFFTPFEDFFVGRRRGRKRQGRIARTSIAGIWRILMTDPACRSAKAAAEALDKTLADGAPDRDAAEAALFDAASQGFARLVTHAEADTSFRADLSERLGGAAALHDLAELNLLSPIVGHLKAMQAAFVRPVASLSEEDLFEARRLYGRARAEARESAPYVLLALAGRMEAPWRAMRIYYHIAATRDDRLPEAREDARLILDALFDDIEGAARGLEREAEGVFDPADTALQLGHFADFAAGMIEEARRERDAVTINRVEACRDIAASALDRFAEQSLAAIRKATPVRHAGGSSRLMALRPDIERAIDDGVQQSGVLSAQFLADVEGLSQRLGRGGAGEAVVADAVTETRRYANDLVVEIRSAEGVERVSAKRRMAATLALAAPLLAANEVSLLKERAAAAAVSA
jgi:hypothetical protein